ncbi:MAG TPA: hypothetical protein PKJ58_05565 [Prolixibacteraceae bacterium]|nr:hypothetical protein [Prolixibacteraceae bacterium]
MEQGEEERMPTMEERIRSLTRSELMMVLRRRKDYRPEAVQVAIAEALRRGLIAGEEDLDRPEFGEPVNMFTFFPAPDQQEGRVRLLRSLLRGVMIAGLIPLVYGVMKFTLQKYAEGGGLVSMGIMWIALAWWIQDRQDKRALLPLSLLLLFALVYAVRILLLFSNPGWTDFLFPLVLFGLLSYFLLYVRSLLTRMASPGGEK